MNKSNVRREWKVLDVYEGCELLGYADTKAEAYKLAHERANDTDGECWIVLMKLVDGKYEQVD